MPGFEERNTTYNSMYIFNLVGGKEFKVGKEKQNIISLNLRSMLRGGYRTIPINIDESIAQDKDVRNYEDAFETKVPDYFRIDASVTLEGNLAKKKFMHGSWILSVYNLTGRKNAYSVYFKSENGQINSYRLSIFGSPIFSITYDFKLGNYNE